MKKADQLARFRHADVAMTLSTEIYVPVIKTIIMGTHQLFRRRGGKGILVQKALKQRPSMPKKATFLLCP